MKNYIKIKQIFDLATTLIIIGAIAPKGEFSHFSKIKIRQIK